MYDSSKFYFYKDFDNESTAEVIKWIVNSNDQKIHNFLTLIINSYGGETASAFALIDTIAWSKIPIVIVGTGMVASCALIVLMAGDYRRVTKNTTLVSHQPSGSISGKAHELFSNNINAEYKRFVKHYCKYTKLPKKIIEAELLPPNDVQLTPKKAKQYNLIDEII